MLFMHHNVYGRLDKKSRFDLFTNIGNIENSMNKGKHSIEIQQIHWSPKTIELFAKRKQPSNFTRYSMHHFSLSKILILTLHVIRRR